MKGKESIVKEYYKCLEDGFEVVHNFDLIYWRLFHKKMVGYRILYDKDVIIHQKLEDINYRDMIFYNSLSSKKIDWNKFLENIYTKEDIVKIDFKNYYETGTLIIGDSYMFHKIDCPDHVAYICIYADSDFDINRIKSYVESYEDKKFEVVCNIVTITPKGGFEATQLVITRNTSVNINLNYNDDLPYNEITEFCKSKECGLTLLYGEPGTGKSTFLKHLISLNDTTFYLMDSSLLSNINQSSFLQFLVNECKDCVIILEDCEKLLVSRDIGHNPILGTLLNLSDGMLGDALNIKFICTFNTEVSNIDKAALRKGRLKISYKFNKLSKDKAQALGKSIGVDINESMTLADIYNQKQVSFGEKKQTKMGF